MGASKLKITFKKLNNEDLVLLHQWFHLPHILKWYARDEKYSFEKLEAKYLPRLTDPHIQGFLIYHVDQPVGYIQLYHSVSYLPETMDYSHPLFTQYPLEEVAGIDFFIADSNYIGKGFASEALEMFIELYLNNKFKIVLVDPLRANKVAISFFKRHGFKPIASPEKSHVLLARNILVCPPSVEKN